MAASNSTFVVMEFLIIAALGIYVGLLAARLSKRDGDSGDTSPPGGAPAPSAPRNRQNERNERGPGPSRGANLSASSSSTQHASNFGPRNRNNQPLLGSPDNDSIPTKPLVTEPYSRASRLSVKKGAEAPPQASVAPLRSSLKANVDQGPAKPRSSRPAPSRPYIQLPTPSRSESGEIPPTSPEALIRWNPVSPPVSRVERPPSPSTSHPFTDRTPEDELSSHPPMQPESVPPSRSISESNLGVAMSEDDSWSHAGSSAGFSDESGNEVNVWRSCTT